MEDMINELTKPVWWFSVIIAGVLVNIGSSYLKSRLDRSLSTTSDWWRQRSASRKEAWAKYIRHLAEPEARIHARHLEIRARLQGIFFLVFGALFTLMGMSSRSLAPDFPRTVIILCLGTGALMVFFSYTCILNAQKRERAIRAALGES
jgi:hypothetical protein